MLIPHDMNGQTVGVLGLGGSGVAAVAALQAAGAHVVAFDDGKYQQDLPAIQMTDWRDWPWQDMAAMVISPGIPHLQPKLDTSSSHHWSCYVPGSPRCRLCSGKAASRCP